jgi:hypothetical protein
MGLVFDCVMHLLERFLNPFYKMFLLEADYNLGLRPFIIGTSTKIFPKAD